MTAARSLTTTIAGERDRAHSAARRRSRIVGYLKLMLPALALALASLILAWPRLVPDDRHFRLGAARIAPDEAEALRLDKARIVGIDQDARPYVITANDATQANGAALDVNLDAPKADITLNNGAWVQLSAKAGIYRRDSSLLDLSGDVSLFHDNGSEFHTATAHVDLKAGTAAGSDPIAGQGPQGNITGEGFEIAEHGARILFTGRARAIMRAVELTTARGLLLTLLGLALSFPAASQDILQHGHGPLAIDADNGIEWRRDEQVYIANGHAKAVRGDLTVLADRLVAHYRSAPAKPGEATAAPKPGDAPAPADASGNIYRVDAIGHVTISTPTQTAVGDHGIYDLDKAVMVLTGGNLKLTTPSQAITARDSLEYWDQRKLAVARGGAVATEKDRRVAGDVLTAHVTQDAKTNASRISRIDAFGNVRISTPTEIAQGAKGVYNVDTQIATLVDQVRVTQGKNQLNGDYAEVNLNTGVSRMLSGNAAGKAGVRVSALIVPNEGSPPADEAADAQRAAGPSPKNPSPKKRP